MHYDIIIIGGGMVGASLACALRSSHFNIALVDATPSIPHSDPRLIALNYSSYCLFQNLDVWKNMQPFSAAINQVHVSHRGRFGITRLTAAEAKLPTLGYVVPAKHINTALYHHFALAKNITLIRPATLKNLTQQPNQVTLSIETTEDKKNIEKNIFGKIIIAADGTHSTVRDLLSIPTKKIDYEQSAIVTITELQRAHENIAYERFLNHGAIAMLPLVGEQVATIWTDQNDRIAELLQQSDEEFLETLQQHFGYRLGKFRKINQRFTFPLQFIFAEQSIKNRVILLGNALHTLSPIAAQGLNLALFEIAELTEYLLASRSIDDISLPQENFFSQAQQKRSRYLSHALSWLFSTDLPFFNIARQISMTGLDSCLTLKKYFTQQAIGQAGKRPILLRNT